MSAGGALFVIVLWLGITFAIARVRRTLRQVPPRRREWGEPW